MCWSEILWIQMPCLFSVRLGCREVVSVTSEYLQEWLRYVVAKFTVFVWDQRLPGVQGLVHNI